VTEFKKTFFAETPTNGHKLLTERVWPYVKSLTIGGHKVKITVDIGARTLDQNAIFHAICGEVAKSGKEFAGQSRTLEEWKALFVSGHAIATKEQCQPVAGLEGEIVLLRESTASMSKARKSSLIEYAKAWCALNGIELREQND
jgi:hypothetical protein